MATRALVLVHDPAEDRRDRVPGALIPALAVRDIKHDVASFVAVHKPEPDLDPYDLILVMGSHESAYDHRVPWLARELAFVTSAVDRGRPVLGICFGGQLQFHPEITLDSFESWTERWTARGETPGTNLDIDALRREVARNEPPSVRMCDRLVGTFCARNL
jgi:hypothetical protein